MKHKKTSLIVATTCLLAFVGSTSSTHAATVVFYDFSTDASPNSELLNTSSTAVTGAGWTPGGSASFGRSGAGNYYGRGPSTTAVTSYVAFTITADGGYTLDLTQLDFDYYVQQEDGGSTGGTFTFEARSSVDGFASTIAGTYSLNPAGTTAPYQDASFDLSGGSYDGLASIEFRLYATSNDGNERFNDIVRWDNITASGDVTVIPEPSSSALVAMGLVGLIGLCRRRKH